MTESPPPDVPELMAPLRAKQPAKKPGRKAKRRKTGKNSDASHRNEALMTLVAIMKDEENPRLQMAAAKTLLSSGFKAKLKEENSSNEAPSQDDIDAALALAKRVL